MNMASLVDVTEWDEIRVWVSLFGASTAGWANMYALWSWRGSWWVQAFYGATGLMAWFYAWGYVFLIVTGDTFTWIDFYQNFGPLVWILVWSVPAIASARAHREELRKIQQTSVCVSDSLQARVDDGMDL